MKRWPYALAALAALGILLGLLGSCQASLLQGIGRDVDETEPTLATKLRGIWVVGGAANLDGTGIHPQLDLYDPASDTWYPDVAAGATGTYNPAVHCAVASLDGKIYVLGGAPGPSAPTSSVFEYDIAADRWTSKQSISSAGVPIALMAPAVFTHQGMIYLVGGTNTTTTAGVQLLNLRFDPAAGADGTWTNMANYTTGRSSMGAAYFQGNGCYFGGRIVGGAGQTTNDIYTIASNNYTGGTEQVIAARAGMAAAANTSINGTYVFIVGGASAFTGTAAAYFSPALTGFTYVPQATSFQVYAPPATAAGLNSGRYHPAFTGGTTTGLVFASAAVSPYNGAAAADPTLYVFGGIQTGLTVTDEVWSMDADEPFGSYTAAGLAWTAKAPMPRARYGHGVTVVNP